MGLDITAYRQLQKIEDPDLDEYGTPIDYDGTWKAYRSSIEWAEQHFPGRSEGIEPDAVYTFADSFGFRAGSYSGYGAWRRDLSQFAGYSGSIDVPDNGPFAELINFADNEGVIGPKVAAKLARDFQEHQPRADRVDDLWWREQYAKWRRAFEMAADNGAVDFH